MAKKEYLVILILLIVIFALSIAIINVDTKQTNSTNVTHEIIANDTLQDSGTVEVIKNKLKVLTCEATFYCCTDSLVS